MEEKGEVWKLNDGWDFVHGRARFLSEEACRA
jgi:hypothetical protein